MLVLLAKDGSGSHSILPVGMAPFSRVVCAYMRSSPLAGPNLSYRAHDEDCQVPEEVARKAPLQPLSIVVGQSPDKVGDECTSYPDRVQSDQVQPRVEKCNEDRSRRSNPRLEPCLKDSPEE